MAAQKVLDKAQGRDRVGEEVTLAAAAHVITKAADAEKKSGQIEAIVSVFDVVDSYGDVMRKGCFEESIARRTASGIWSHTWDSPVARTDEIRELAPGDAKLPESIRDKGGLYVRASFNLETQRGREAFSDIDFGIVREFSIGFRITEGRWSVIDDDDVFEITKVELYEWSPVIAGANPKTALISTKSGTRSGAKLKDELAGALAVASRVGARLSRLKKQREGRLPDERRADVGDLCFRLFGLLADEGQLDRFRALLAEAGYEPKTDDEPARPEALDDEKKAQLVESASRLRESLG